MQAAKTLQQYTMPEGEVWREPLHAVHTVNIAFPVSFEIMIIFDKKFLYYIE